MRMLLVLLLSQLLAAGAAVAGDAARGLTLDYYDNTALAAPAASSTVLPSLEGVPLLPPSTADAGAAGWSAEITGVVRLLRNESYSFACGAVPAGVDLMFLHVGDHLVCQYGAYGDGPMDGGGAENPLTALASDSLVFRLTMYSTNGSRPWPPAAGLPALPHLTVRWSVDRPTPDARPRLAEAAGRRASAPPAPAAAAAHGDGGYTRWPRQNIDTVHAMIGAGGNYHGTREECEAKCEQLAAQGCVGFVTTGAGLSTPAQASECLMRKRANPTDDCASIFDTDVARRCAYAVFTRNASCPFPPDPPATLGPGVCGPPKFVAIPPARLSPTLPPAEVERRALQDGQKQGWAHWYHRNVLRLVLLPQGYSVILGWCDTVTGRCLNATSIDKGDNVRVGLHAYNRSYAQLYFWGPQVNISLEFSGGQQLQLRATRVDNVSSGDRNSSRNIVLVVAGATTWKRANTVSLATAPDRLHFATTAGSLPAATLSRIDDTPVHDTVSTTGGDQPAASAQQVPQLLRANPHWDCRPFHGQPNGCVHFAVPLAPGESLRFSTSSTMTTAQLDAHFATAHAVEEATYTAFGPLAEVKLAVQAAVMWNYIYTPVEYGPLALVAGGWDFTHCACEFSYSIFDWCATSCSSSMWTLPPACARALSADATSTADSRVGTTRVVRM
jgi:hypothetical protein